MKKKPMRSIEYTEDHLNSVYANILNGIAEGASIDDFNPPLNEYERELYQSAIKHQEQFQGCVAVLYDD